MDLSGDAGGGGEGLRPVVLMCAPRLYDVRYVINPWMEGNVAQASRERAMRQWEGLRGAVAEVADVQLIEPEAGWPDMVFTANAGLAREGRVVVSRFLHPERQGEEEHFGRWFRDAGYEVVELPRETPFEGEGDALFSTDGGRLWVGHGPRTGIGSHAALRAIWPGVEVCSLRLTDPRFYHLDTCFAPLGNGDLLYFPAAFDTDSLRVIEQFYPAKGRIAVEEADAACFACNAVALGKTVVMSETSAGLRRRLEERGFRVVQVELDEFLKAGGAAKCLTMLLTPELHQRAPAEMPGEEGVRV